MFLRHFHQKELVTKLTCHRQHLMLLDLCGTFSSQLIIDWLQLVAQTETSSIEVETNVNKPFDEGIMVVDEVRRQEEWTALLDCKCFHQSVYAMQVIDSLMQPAPDILSSLPADVSTVLEKHERRIYKVQKRLY